MFDRESDQAKPWFEGSVQALPRGCPFVGFISCKDCDALFHKAQGPRLPSVEPKSPPGCSDRTATGPSAMLRR